MFGRSRRTLEAILTQASDLLIALAGPILSDPGRSRRNQQKTPNSPGQPRHLSFTLSFTRPRGGSFLAREVAALTICRFGEIWTFNSITDIRRRIDH